MDDYSQPDVATLRDALAEIVQVLRAVEHTDNQQLALYVKDAIDIAETMLEGC